MFLFVKTKWDWWFFLIESIAEPIGNGDIQLDSGGKSIGIDEFQRVLLGNSIENK